MATMVRTYGQMPRQLFVSPHLPHFRLKAPPPAKLPKVRPLSPHCPQTHTRMPVESPVASVSGIRWGGFVGSPSAGPEAPILVLKKQAGTSTGPPPSSLLALPDHSVVGLPSEATVFWKPHLQRASKETVLASSQA